MSGTTAGATSSSESAAVLWSSLQSTRAEDCLLLGPKAAGVLFRCYPQPCPYEDPGVTDPMFFSYAFFAILGKPTNLDSLASVGLCRALAYSP